MTNRKEIFNAVQRARGKGWKAAEVTRFDAELDRLGVPKDTAEFDKEAFYKGVRAITGPLDQIQVDVIEAILKETAGWGVSWRAYAFATAWHEARFKPQEEWGKGKGKPYAKPGKYGQPQYGRGLVQCTWDTNYEWLDEAAAKAGLIKRGELLANFSLALRPDIAVFALVEGMKLGAYTTKKLADYLPASGSAALAQFVPPRRIINGTDRAADIAKIAVDFQSALQAGGMK